MKFQYESHIVVSILFVLFVYSPIPDKYFLRSAHSPFLKSIFLSHLFAFVPLLMPVTLLRYSQRGRRKGFRKGPAEHNINVLFCLFYLESLVTEVIVKLHALSCKLLYSEVFANKMTVEAQASSAPLSNSAKYCLIYSKLLWQLAAILQTIGPLFCSSLWGEKRLLNVFKIIIVCFFVISFESSFKE